MVENFTDFAIDKNGWIGEPIFANKTCGCGKICLRSGRCFQIAKECGISPVLRKKFDLKNWSHKTPITFVMNGNNPTSSARIVITAKGNNSDPVVLFGAHSSNVGTERFTGVFEVTLQVEQALTLLDSEVEIIIEQSENCSTARAGETTIETISVNVELEPIPQVFFPEMKVNRAIISEKATNLDFSRTFVGEILIDGSKITQEFTGNLVITIVKRSSPDDPLTTVQETIPITNFIGEVLVLDPRITDLALNSNDEPLLTIELIETISENQFVVRKFETLPRIIPFVDPEVECIDPCTGERSFVLESVGCPTFAPCPEPEPEPSLPPEPEPIVADNTRRNVAIAALGVGGLALVINQIRK